MVTRTSRIRQALGLSQGALGKRLGLSQARVSDLERGHPESGPVSILLDQLELQISQAPQAPAEADGEGDERAACRPSPSAAGRAA